MAQNGGDLFAQVSQETITQLKASIEVSKPTADAAGKNKDKQWRHARDNAISALGKVIRYQSHCIDVNVIVPSWVQLLPISADIDEAKIQASILADLLEQ